MRIRVKGYEETKYEATEKAFEVEYTDVAKVEVKEISREEIEAETDGSCLDEYNEYCIISFLNGETATFRNSHVDIFMA